jgi:hypothetical protein
MDIMVDPLLELRHRPQPVNNFIKALLSLKTANAFLVAQVAARKASSFLVGFYRSTNFSQQNALN